MRVWEPVSGARFRVGQIDHVELFVPSRYEAARWYQEVLGLDILPDVEDWAREAGGPLMLSSDGGNTKLALFRGEPRGTRPTAGHHRVAFRVDGQGFTGFVRRVRTEPVFDDAGEPLRCLTVVDHDRALSVYFCDPWGNRFDASLCNIRASRRDRPVVDVVDSFPADVSVYGARGMAGNTSDWTSTEVVHGEGERARPDRLNRGGAWSGEGRGVRCAARNWSLANSVWGSLGFRLARST